MVLEQAPGWPQEGDLADGGTEADLDRARRTTQRSDGYQDRRHARRRGARGQGPRAGQSGFVSGSFGAPMGQDQEQPRPPQQERPGGRKRDQNGESTASGEESGEPGTKARAKAGNSSRGETCPSLPHSVALVVAAAAEGKSRLAVHYQSGRYVPYRVAAGLALRLARPLARPGAAIPRGVAQRRCRGGVPARAVAGAAHGASKRTRSCLQLQPTSRRALRASRAGRCRQLVFSPVTPLGRRSGAARARARSFRGCRSRSRARSRVTR